MGRQSFIRSISCVCFVLFSVFGSSSISAQDKRVDLKVSVEGLRNSDGPILFSIYNRDDAFPDENFKKQISQMRGIISENKSSVTFSDLPPGRYAVSILHDEDKNGKITKGRVLPIEGIGFTNYTSINILNRPNFKKAAFDLKADTSVTIKAIYF